MFDMWWWFGSGFHDPFFTWSIRLARRCHTHTAHGTDEGLSGLITFVLLTFQFGFLLVGMGKRFCRLETQKDKHDSVVCGNKTIHGCPCTNLKGAICTYVWREDGLFWTYLHVYDMFVTAVEMNLSCYFHFHILVNFRICVVSCFLLWDFSELRLRTACG